MIRLMALAIALLQATNSPHPTIQQLTSNPPGLDGTEITVSLKMRPPMGRSGSAHRLNRHQDPPVHA